MNSQSFLNISVCFHVLPNVFTSLPTFFHIITNFFLLETVVNNKEKCVVLKESWVFWLWKSQNNIIILVE